MSGDADASPGTTVPDQGRILVLVDDADVERLSRCVEAGGYEATTLRPGQREVIESSDPFDLCIGDTAGLRAAADALARHRRRHDIFCPCLLVDDDDSPRLRSEVPVRVDGVVSPTADEETVRCQVDRLLSAPALSIDLADRIEQYRSLLELTLDGIALVDDGRLVYCNEVAEAILGGQGPTGREFLEFVAPSDREAVETLLTDAAGGKRADRSVDAVVETPGGTRTGVELVGTPVAHDDGVAVQLLLRDPACDDSQDDQPRLYGRAMSEVSIGMTIADVTQPDDPVVYASEAFETMTGYSLPELIGNNCRFLQGPDTAPGTTAEIRSAIEAGEPTTVTVRNYHADGTPFWNELELAPMSTADGPVTHYLGFQRDVTARVERERQISALYELSRDLMAATTDREVAELTVEAATEVLDLPAVGVHFLEDGRLVPVAASESSRELLGDIPSFAPGEAIAWDVYEDGEPRLVEDLRAEDNTYNPDTPIESELIVPLGDHGVLVSGGTEPDAFDESDVRFGETLGMNVTSSLDRVEREAALRRRQQELERYETIVRAAGEAICTVDADGRFVDVNEALLELTGYGPDCLVGEHVSLLLPEDDVDAAEEILADLEERRRDGVTEELVVQTADGERRRCLVSAAALPFDEEFRGVVAVVRDISERHRREQRLEVMDRVLRHNLRTELNVIRGRMTLIDDEADSEHVAEIDHAIEALLSLSEGARRFHRAFHGDDTASEAIDVVPVIESIVERYRPRHPEADIRTDLPDRAEARAHHAVRICLEELLENAVIHGGDRPTVTVSVAVKDGRVTITVDDDGPGLPAAERKTIESEMESPLDHASGLGLWLVSWLVESSGGEVSCSVPDDGGTTVEVRFSAADTD